MRMDFTFHLDIAFAPVSSPMLGLSTMENKGASLVLCPHPWPSWLSTSALCGKRLPQMMPSPPMRPLCLDDTLFLRPRSTKLQSAFLHSRKPDPRLLDPFRDPGLPSSVRQLKAAREVWNFGSTKMYHFVMDLEDLSTFRTRTLSWSTPTPTSSLSSGHLAPIPPGSFGPPMRHTRAIRRTTSTSGGNNAMTFFENLDILAPSLVSWMQMLPLVASSRLRLDAFPQMRKTVMAFIYVNSCRTLTCSCQQPSKASTRGPPWHGSAVPPDTLQDAGWTMLLFLRSGRPTFSPLWWCRTLTWLKPTLIICLFSWLSNQFLLLLLASLPNVSPDQIGELSELAGILTSGTQSSGGYDSPLGLLTLIRIGNSAMKSWPSLWRASSRSRPLSLSVPTFPTRLGIVAITNDDSDVKLLHKHTFFTSLTSLLLSKLGEQVDIFIKLWSQASATFFVSKLSMCAPRMNTNSANRSFAKPWLTNESTSFIRLLLKQRMLRPMKSMPGSNGLAFAQQEEPDTDLCLWSEMLMERLRNPKRTFTAYGAPTLLVLKLAVRPNRISYWTSATIQSWSKDSDLKNAFYTTSPHSAVSKLCWGSAIHTKRRAPTTWFRNYVAMPPNGFRTTWLLSSSRLASTWLSQSNGRGASFMRSSRAKATWTILRAIGVFL